jgi:hypothetical protein
MSPIIAAWLSKAIRGVMRMSMKSVVWTARRLLRHVDH